MSQKILMGIELIFIALRYLFILIYFYYKNNRYINHSKFNNEANN